MLGEKNISLRKGTSKLVENMKNSILLKPDRAIDP
jgi:hypothetical protein